MKAGGTHLIYEEPIEVANYAVRGCIVAGEGKKLVVSDLEQIEARTLPWLAGEEWKVDVFRRYDAGEGFDVYTVTAAKIRGKAPEDVTKDERQAYGKVVELACGYGGAAGAFAQFAKIYGVNLPEWEIYEIVREWRAAHPALCDWDFGFWKQLDDAAREAILNPGRITRAGEHIRFERWRNWLRMYGPSGDGTCLSYAAPAIAEDPRRPGNMSVCYMGLNNYTKRWERIFTYGGKLSADATQWTAREVLASNLPEIEEAGYLPVLLVHDESVTETPDDVNFSVDKLNALVSKNASWNAGLPLAADGFEAYRYRK
jgi:DNA polymerase